MSNSSQEESYRSPRARALHDFILEQINGKPFNTNIWKNGYNSLKHNQNIAPWKKAFSTPPEQPPTDYLSAIRLLMADCGSNHPINFSWLKEPGIAGHSILMTLVNASFGDMKNGKKQPDSPKLANALLDALLKNPDGSDAPWTNEAAFRRPFAETIAIIPNHRYTLLTDAILTKDLRLFERIFAIYEQYSPKAIIEHMANVSKDGLTMLAGGANTADGEILTKICELYRTNLDKETIQAHLQQCSHPHEFNMMHNLLAGSYDGKHFGHFLDKKAAISAMQLFVYAFGEEKGSKVVHSKTKRNSVIT